MAERIENDELLVALRKARPEPEQDGNDGRALLAQIVSGGSERRLRPMRWSIGAAVAAVTVVALVAPRLAGPMPIDIALVAAKSQQQLEGSGRADVRFVTDRGLEYESEGVTAFSFDGDDLDMIVDFDGERGRPGFQAHIRTVDGELYKLDGPPDAKRWYHDVNADDMTRSDLFNVDPRTLLELLENSAHFEVVDEKNDVRHLRATKVERVPSLNFGNGPATDGSDVQKLDLWVGRDDVVRKIDLALELTETHESGGETVETRNADGTYSKSVQPGTARNETVTHRSSYSVRFFDLGAPISIVAPGNAEQVEGKG
jgi:hypothetical protein